MGTVTHTPRSPAGGAKPRAGALTSHPPEKTTADWALCISATSGGGGKTLLSLGLARALADRSVTVKTYKKGPDYIDAAWLSAASRHPCTNLDPFFLPPPDLRALFAWGLAQLAPKAPLFALVEGNRGLYDGLDREGSCSTAELCYTLSIPVVLCITCRKMTRTVAALVQGLCRFDPRITVAGLVLNRVGTTRQAELLREVLEHYTDVPVLGILPNLGENLLPERHMGLASQGPTLADDAEERLSKLAQLVMDHVNIDQLMACSRTTPKGLAQQFSSEAAATLTGAQIRPLGEPKTWERVRIGVLRDQSFWFYYEENLQALRAHGAELVFLDSFGRNSEGRLGTDIFGLYAGGGFPEDTVDRISESPFLQELAKLVPTGFPIYAECGGFMLLARTLTVHGQSYPMANIFPVDVEFCAKPQGLGYTEGVVTGKNPFFPLGLSLKGHEFHYSRALGAEQATTTCTLSRGTGMGVWEGQGHDGLVTHAVWASYTHIFAPAVPCWAPSFLRLARIFSQNAPQ